MNNVADRDDRYLETVLRAIRVCAAYKPKMGHGAKAGLSLKDFRALYGADPFYKWFGLDNPLMYAAHRAAGGMTSVYRQIGIACESLFRAILQDELGLSEEESNWSYSLAASGRKPRKLSLDARIPLAAIAAAGARKRVAQWIRRVGKDLDIEPKVAQALQGAVFEVRQGYKSKDSKRQNADLANAATAYTQAYLPCVLLMSSQIDADIVTRYRHEKWAILSGEPRAGNPCRSTYDFMRDVVGYDLAAFFERHAESLQTEMAGILEALLRAE